MQFILTVDVRLDIDLLGIAASQSCVVSVRFGTLRSLLGLLVVLGLPLTSLSSLSS